jgi:acetoin utilization deacetylase AcuC-like enzyme
MALYFITHENCLHHRPNDGHPESPARLAAIHDAVRSEKSLDLSWRNARCAGPEDILRVHGAGHLTAIENAIPEQGLNFIDDDTLVCPQSYAAALHAAGAVLDGVDAVLAQRKARAFCAVRPPGHHAHAARAGGFCLFNNVAIGAAYALSKPGIARVAIVDIDVHHGDGTQDIAEKDPRIFFASLHQSPLYPFTGAADETGRHGNVLNMPLAAATDGEYALSQILGKVLPRLDAFRPDILFVSAGYDAHRDDPLGGLSWTDKDYHAMFSVLCDAADRLCAGHVVASLEGGYNISALARSVVASLYAMQGKDMP